MIEIVRNWFAITMDRRAVTALECGLIAGLVVETLAVGFSFLGNSLSTQFINLAGSP